MNKKTSSRLLWAVVCFMFISGLLGGCSPAMRRKFIRQKKQEEDHSLVPLLEPIDYPNQLETSKTRYDYFYALLKVWQKDALTLIDDEHADKQITYTIRQMHIQLEELEKILTGSSKEKAVEGQKKVDEILAFYDKPPSFRNRDIIRKHIQKIRSDVIQSLEFENIKDDLK